MTATTNNIDLELTEAERRDELPDSKLDAVTGGFEYTERTLGGPDTRLASDPNGGGAGPAIGALLRPKGA